MSQKLVLPINNARVEASYRNATYAKQFGFQHYGIDLTSTKGIKTLYACGIGTVIACGQDGATLTGANSGLGNAIVIVYKDVLFNDGRIENLSARIFHCDKILCKVGDEVTKNTVIGEYGNTGANTTGAHLHIEFDTDIEWPQYAVGIKAGGNVIKRGTVDTTVDPSAVWFCDYNQTITGYGNGWSYAKDVNLIQLPKEVTAKSELDIANERIIALTAEVATLTADLIKANNKLVDIKKILES